jgi:hypothetical protein
MSVVTVSNKSFDQLIAERAHKLLGLADYLSRCRASNEFLIRPFLGEFLSESMQLEELLDAYDARNNCRWCLFRSLIAAIKLFSDVSYELLHIQHALPAYRLLPIEHDFAKATQETLEFTGGVLTRAASQALAIAGELGLPVPLESPGQNSFCEELPPGRLLRNCRAHRTETVSEIVALLATAFLNLAAESKDVRAACGAVPEEYNRYLARSVSEESLRSLELRFHSLQSLYDTHVSGTQAESLDADLLVLRGHISVVFHLLKTSTLFAHYYERHVNKQPCDIAAGQETLARTEVLLGVLMKYSITYISLYIGCAENLCRQMLKRYAEVGRVEVPIPSYRGFHVRPATLIAKIVHHYGSKVRMQVDEEIYDASSALELFRANEKINAQKRRRLAGEVVRLRLLEEQVSADGIGAVVRNVVTKLAEQGELVLYEQPLQIPQELVDKHSPVLEQITDATVQLLAMGKIDIHVDMIVTFVGDKRVLADIAMLAESGYGEDSFGNNVPLPEKLTYLRK